jgi:alginate O-acetyltransferase complex protein AlgI
MSVSSVEFLLLLLLASAVFPWLPTVRLRQLFFAVCSAGFLYSLIPDLKGWVALGLFLGSGYAVSKLLQRYPRPWMLAVYVALLVAAFLVLKHYRFLALLLPTSVIEHTISIVGLSYMLFRQIHVAVDALQGQIDDLSLWTYINYQVNLFGLLAGPIQRYQTFAEEWNRLEPLASDMYEILRDYIRVFVGVIKVAVIAAICLFYYERYLKALTVDLPSSPWKDRAKFMVMFYLYPIYIYFNFSGYCDIVIGGARRFGIEMPENFDLPFLSRNMIEYWTRWHRTLGFWIRDYVFTPLYMTIAVNWPKRAASLAFLCYFVALFLAGVWHGATWNFVIFGLLNAVGVSAAKLWEVWLIQRRGQKGFKQYMQSEWVRVLAVVGTFHFVCLTILFFPSDLNRSLQMLADFVVRRS